MQDWWKLPVLSLRYNLETSFKRLCQQDAWCCEVLKHGAWLVVNMILALGMKGFDKLLSNFTSSEDAVSTDNILTLNTTVTTTEPVTTTYEDESEQFVETIELSTTFDESVSSESLVKNETLIEEVTSSEITTTDQPELFELSFSSTTEDVSTTVAEDTITTTTVAATTESFQNVSSEPFVQQVTSSTTSQTSDILPSKSLFDDSYLTIIISVVSVTTLILLILVITCFLVHRCKKKFKCCDSYLFYKCWYSCFTMVNWLIYLVSKWSCLFSLLQPGVRETVCQMMIPQSLMTVSPDTGQRSREDPLRLQHTADPRLLLSALSSDPRLRSRVWTPGLRRCWQSWEEFTWEPWNLPVCLPWTLPWPRTTGISDKFNL